jgi:hypothetical protein
MKKLTKIEAVRHAVVKWQEIADGKDSNKMCALCEYTRKNPHSASNCDKCPLLNKWPVAIQIKSKIRTTKYCIDKESAWSVPGIENTKLIVIALEQLLKELEADKFLSSYKEPPDYIDPMVSDNE